MRSEYDQDTQYGDSDNKQIETNNSRNTCVLTQVEVEKAMTMQQKMATHSFGSIMGLIKSSVYHFETRKAFLLSMLTLH